MRGRSCPGAAKCSTLDKMVKVTPLLLPNLSLLLSLFSNFKSNRYPGTKEADETWCHDHDPSNQPELAFLRIGKGRATMSSMVMGLLLLPQTEVLQNQAAEVKRQPRRRDPRRCVA